MPKSELIPKYKGTASPTIVSRASVVSTVSTDHGSLSGLNDDDHGAIYPGIGQAESITGDWTFTGSVDLSAATVSLDCAAPDADSVNVAASSEGSNSTYSRSDHTHNLDEGIAPTWTSGHTFQATMSTYDVLPGATDSYDLGSSTYWYSQMFVSQINAAVFAEEQIALLGGWLYVSHDAGTFAAEVGASDTTIDFGKAMTVSDFIVVKAYDKSGTVKTEYIQVGSLVSGTTYNVTRDLAAAHGTDPNWAAGTPFAVLGQTGDGRIELNAYDAPRIQIIVQDDAVTYSNTTEYLRLGDMNGAFGSDAADEWGLGVGDYSGGNYLAYNTTDGFEMKTGDGALKLSDTGMVFVDASDSTSRIYWKETDFSGDTLGYITSDWAGGATDVITWITAWVVSGSVADDAQVILNAQDVDAGTDVRVGVASDETGYFGPGIFYINTSGQASSNTNMTNGLTILQGANDDEILAFKSSDVAHGITDEAETDTFGTFLKSNADAGGLLVAGYRDSGGDAGFALNLQGNLGETADTTKTTAGIGVVNIRAAVQSGTTVAAVGSDGNLLSIRNLSTTRYLFDAEGSAHADVEWTTFDEHDDLDLLDTLETTLTSWQGDALKEGFGSWLADNQHELERLKLVTFDHDNPGHVMLNTTRMLMLLTGACRQLGERLAIAERKLLTA